MLLNPFTLPVQRAGMSGLTLLTTALETGQRRMIMKEYRTREDAENDPELDLRIIYECNKCRSEREDYPNYNIGGKCHCGGTWIQVGERYNAF